MIENHVLARYGLSSDSESAREYAGIEAIENGSIDRVAQDVVKCLEEANFAEDGQSQNPWFNDRQVMIINTYMDGLFAPELLASEKRPDVCSHDALLAHLVAACDSSFGDSWHDNICAVLDAVNDPLPESEIRDADKFPQGGKFIPEFGEKQNGAYLAVSCPFAKKAMEAIAQMADDPDFRNGDIHEGFPDGSVLFQLGRGFQRSAGLFDKLKDILREIGASEKDYMLEIDAASLPHPEFRGRLKSCASPKPSYLVDTDPETDPKLGGKFGVINPFLKLAKALSENFDEDQIRKWAKVAVSDLKQKGPAAK